MKKQKLRNEIDNQYKWDLTTIFKTDEEFLKEYEDLKSNIKEISKYEELIKKDLSCLYDMISLYYNLCFRLEKLHMYTHLNLDSDTTNEKYQEYYGKVVNLFDDFSKLTSYITPSLMRYDYKDILKAIESDSRLDEYKFTLEKIFRDKDHTLSEIEEKLISNLGKAFDSSYDIFEKITDSDFKFGTIKDEDGNEVELTGSNYSVFIRSKDRRVREDAYNCYYKEYIQFKNTLSKTLSNHVEGNIAFSKVRKYNSALEAELYSDNIDKEVVDTLISAVSNNLEPLYNYYRIMKDALGVDKLHFYDLFCPVVEDYDKNYTFEEAKEIVLKVTSIFGEDYLNNIKRAFDEKWIDVYNNKGKRGGAYSSGMKGTNPFLLLNFEGKLDDVSTLIHELGHSMHTLYTSENNTFEDSFYTIFVAEVASTVNELLLGEYILKNSNDDKEKLAIVSHLLELYKSTLFRQTMFEEFEKRIYDLSSNGEILTSDLMSEEYLNIVKKYFGDTIEYDDNIKYEYLRIPHFYYNFYVFTYATGISYATKIARDIMNNKENAKENYIKFLKSGGSKYPMDELLIAGVDVHDKNVYLEAINHFDELVKEYEILVKKVK